MAINKQTYPDERSSALERPQIPWESDVLMHAPFGFASHEIITNEAGIPIDYRFLSVNPAFEKATGLKAEQLIGKAVTEVLPAITLDPFDWITFYGQLAQQGGNEEFEQFSIALQQWYKVQAYSSGNGYFYTCFTNITNEKKQLKELEEKTEALRANSNLLDQITSSISDLVFMTDLSLKATYVSESIFNITGETPAEFLAKPIEKIHPPETLQLFQQVLEEELAREADPSANPNRSRQIEAEQYDKNGQLIPVFEHIRFLRDAQGKPRGIIGTTRDLRPQKAMEARSQDQKNYLSSLIRSIPDLIVVLNKNGLIQDIKSSEFFPMKFLPDWQVGKNIRQVSDDSFKQSFVKHANEVFSNSQSESFEFVQCIESESHFFEARLVQLDTQHLMMLVRNNDKQAKSQHQEAYLTALFEAAMHQSPIGMFVVEANPPRVRLMNEAIRQLRDFEDPIHAPIDYFEYASAIQLLSIHGVPITVEEYPSYRSIHFGEEIKNEPFLVQDRNGQERRLLISSTPFRDQAQNIQGAVTFLHDVTDDWTTEQELAEANDKFRRLVENAPFIIYIYSNIPGKNFHSAATEQLTGFSSELFDRNPSLWTSRVHPDDLVRVEASVQEARKSKTPIKLEYRFRDAQENWRWFEDRSSVIHQEGTDIIVEGIIRDITESREAQLNIRKLSSAIEQSPVSIVITNLQSEIEYVNPHFTVVSGYRVDEVAGKNPRMLQSPKSRLWNDYKQMWKHLKQGMAWRGEFINAKKSGEEYWEHATIAPLFNDAGETTHYIAVKEDITERKRSEEALRVFAERLEQITTYSRTIAFDLDRQGKLDYVSQAILPILGYDPEEILHQSFVQLSPANWTEGSKAEWHRRLINREPFANLRRPFLHKNGQTKWFSINAIPRVNDQGELLGMRGSITDVTEQHEAQVALQESEKRFRSVFHNNASPMYLLDPESGQFVDLNQAAENFYGWPRNQFLQKNIREVNYSSTDVARKMELLMEDKQQHFEFKHWNATGDIRDVEVFSTILEIEGRLLIHEIVHDITERNQYLSTIDQQNKILRDITWTQSHLVRAPLARIEGLVALLRSHANLDQVDKKQTFQSVDDVYEALFQSAKELDEMVRSVAVKAQVVQAMDKGLQRQFTDKLQTDSKSNQQPFDFLIVDDDHIVQMLQKHLLVENGLHETPISLLNGKEAVDYLEKKMSHPGYRCIILLDINMPVLDGWGFLDALHQMPNHDQVFIVMMTSSITEEDQKRAMTYPQVVEFMHKPMQADTAKTIIRNHRIRHFWL